MASAKVVDQYQPAVVTMSAKELLRVAIIGLVTGLLTYAIFLLLDRYVFASTLCGSAGLEARCADKSSYASSISLVIGAFGALFAAVQQRVYRPLLVVLLVTFGLWGVSLLIMQLPWWGATLAAGLVFALAYAAFAWVIQLRNLYLAVGLGALLLLTLRLILSA